MNNESLKQQSQDDQIISLHCELDIDIVNLEALAKKLDNIFYDIPIEIANAIKTMQQSRDLLDDLIGDRGYYDD